MTHVTENRKIEGVFKAENKTKKIAEKIKN
jgi:hypothetical protein